MPPTASGTPITAETKGGDGDRQGQSFEAGHLVPDALRQQDVRAPGERTDQRPGNSDEVELPLPGLREQHDADQCQRRPGEHDRPAGARPRR